MPPTAAASRCAWTTAPSSTSACSSRPCSTCLRGWRRRAPSPARRARARPSPCPSRSPATTSWSSSWPCPPTSGCPDPAATPRRPHTETSMSTTLPTADEIRHDWASSPRWAGITRNYSAEDVVRLRGTVHVEHSLARLGAEKLWTSLHERPYVNALGALTGNQAMQQVKAGLKAIYLSGWQVAADANLAGETYPDQSLYPANSVPQVVKRINNALLRADQLHHAEGDDSIDFLQPIVADAEAGFGGVLNAFELMKAMIEAGAAGVHFEDQLASVKK